MYVCGTIQNDKCHENTMYVNMTQIDHRAVTQEDNGVQRQCRVQRRYDNIIQRKQFHLGIVKHTRLRPNNNSNKAHL